MEFADFGSVGDFLNGYKSVPDGSSNPIDGDATMISVRGYLSAYLAQASAIGDATSYINQHFNMAYLAIFCTGEELATAPADALAGLVAPQFDGIDHQSFWVVGVATFDVSRMRLVLDNYFFFQTAADITVADTAANIASLQSTGDYTPLGAAVVTFRIVDSASALLALSPDAARDLRQGGATSVDVSDDRLEMDLTQFRGLRGFDFAEDDRHIVRGTSGDDQCVATDQWTSLHGGRGDDRLELGSGGGVIVGGRGHDLLVGSDGADIFSFAKTDDSSARPDNADVIGNFGEGDVIRLTFLDGLDGRPSLHWIGDAAFSSSAGEVRFIAQGWQRR